MIESKDRQTDSLIDTFMEEWREYLEEGEDELMEENKVVPCRTFEVEMQPFWSLFKYIYKPQYAGMSDIYNDTRIYFTIPLGSDTELTTFNYITFPMNALDSEVKEFYYYYPTNSTVIVGEEES